MICANLGVKKGLDIDVITLVPTYPVGKVFSGYKNRLFKKDKYKKINIYRVYAVTGYRENIKKKIKIYKFYDSRKYHWNFNWQKI